MKRPDHNDFRTTYELKGVKFSGMRDNTLAGQYEIWVAGEILGTVSHEAASSDPLALTKKYADVFAISK